MLPALALALAGCASAPPALHRNPAFPGPQPYTQFLVGARIQVSSYDRQQGLVSKRRDLDAEEALEEELAEALEASGAKELKDAAFSERGGEELKKLELAGEDWARSDLAVPYDEGRPTLALWAEGHTDDRGLASAKLAGQIAAATAGTFTQVSSPSVVLRWALVYPDGQVAARGSLRGGDMGRTEARRALAGNALGMIGKAD